MTNVLLPSVTFGDGHHHVGFALKEAFVDLLNGFRATNVRRAKFLEGSSYEWITRYTPSILNKEHLS